jgi:hypothetical protein
VARLNAGPRAVAALLVLAGLMLTMNAAAPAVRVREPKAGYQVLAADLHVHSFPGDGLLPPWDLAVEARRRGLDAIALTNHNAMYSWHVARWLAPITRRAGGALLLPGQELTSAGYHLALIGISTPVPWRQSAAAAAAGAHAQGGIAIAAHPSRRSWPYLTDADLVALDGVEVAHPMILDWPEWRRDLLAFYDRARTVHPSIAAIGSTDFHRLAPVGLGRTYLLVKAATPEAILDAIRAGRTVACDGTGKVYGPPELLEMVRDDCRRDASSPPDGQTTLERVGTWLAWLGVVALVVFGPD